MRKLRVRWQAVEIPWFRICLIGVYGALVVTYVWGLASRKGEVFEVLANLLIIAGALIVAGGVRITNKERDALIRLSQDKRAHYASYDELLSLRIEVATLRNADTTELLAEQARRAAAKTHALPQRFLARGLVRSADWAVAGTMLIALGTALLSSLAYFKKPPDTDCHRPSASAPKLPDTDRKDCAKG